MKTRSPQEALYYPLLDWIISQMPTQGYTLVGVNGPQGIGKSTCCAFLVEAFRQRNIPALTLSIDDFYLTFAEQRDLGRSHPLNPYLQQRGYPGTHDVELGERVLRKLKAGGYGSFRLPAYDKGAHQGRGDRRPAEEGPLVHEPLRVVLLEGWMLGFQPVREEEIHDPHLVTVNRILGTYSRWMNFVDLFVQLSPHNVQDILEWRVESERNRRQKGEGALSDEEARRYIELFMPAYELYLPTLTTIRLPKIRFEIGRDRLPLS